MTRAEILQADEAAEFATSERCSILEFANDPAIRRFRSRARTGCSGVTTAWHRLVGVSERYLIVSGRGALKWAIWNRAWSKLEP